MSIVCDRNCLNVENCCLPNDEGLEPPPILFPRTTTTTVGVKRVRIEAVFLRWIDCNGTAKRTEAEHAKYILQDQPDVSHRLPSSGVSNSRLRVGILPRRRSGAAQVRPRRLERVV